MEERAVQAFCFSVPACRSAMDGNAATKRITRLRGDRSSENGFRGDIDFLAVANQAVFPTNCFRLRTSSDKQTGFLLGVSRPSSNGEKREDRTPYGLQRPVGASHERVLVDRTPELDFGISITYIRIPFCL